MSAEAQQIAGEVADYLRQRDAEKAEAHRRKLANPLAAGSSAFLDALRREWTDAGIIPVRSDSAPATLRIEPTEDEVQAAARKGRLVQFQEICPAEFRPKIDEALLPNLGSWREADKWDGSHLGIFLWSHETGRAKTRMLWRQFGRLYVERGKRVIKFTGQKLAEVYFGYHMDGDPSGFYRWIMSHQVLMLDDLDKIRFDDERATRMLRELFDQLYSARHAVLATSNEPIEFFSKHIGESGARRIRAVCREIKF